MGTRISVIGSSGSGKTWTASRLAAKLGVPHVELDAIRHGPNWEPMPDDEFRRTVAEIAERDSWVIDGNYTSFVRDIVWGRATTIVWLDYPLATIMRQVIPRSVARVVFRRQLWNGNVERWRGFLDPDHPIRWAWRRYDEKRERDARMVAKAADRGVEVKVLRSPRETRAWITQASWS
jgi:adenylate kinase family enzyme